MLEEGALLFLGGGSIEIRGRDAGGIILPKVKIMQAECGVQDSRQLGRRYAVPRGEGESLPPSSVVHP